MPESFTNALRRSVGVVTTSSSGSIGANATTITGISTAGVAVGYLVGNGNFIGGAKVSAVGVGQVTVDRTSTNTSSTSTQSVSFVGLTTIYASTGQKSILIGGTLANNTTNQVSVTVQVSSGSTSLSTSYNLLYNIPVPAGSSVVISDAGKTLLNASDEIRVGSSVANSLDVTLAILQGVA
jgi:hypothetical protein